MTRNLEQVAQDLERLQAATVTLDQDLQRLYQEYLAALGQATNKQLILAVYHLCTQVYAEEFLRLTVAQREKLQARLRKIASEGRDQIVQLGQLLRPPDSQEREQRSPVREEVELPNPEMQPEQVSSSLVSAPSPEADTSEMLSAALGQDITQSVQSWGRSLSFAQLWQQEPFSPVILAKRHVLLERHLRAILQTLSNVTNYLLKKMQVLPDYPEIVLAAATESAPENMTSTVPNLLNIVMEIGRASPPPDDSKNATAIASDQETAPPIPTSESTFENEETQEATYLVVLNLRLADIEFADTHAALWRSKIQAALVKLKQLGSRYQTLQQEKARAEAEHAWRSTWFDA